MYSSDSSFVRHIRFDMQNGSFSSTVGVLEGNAPLTQIGNEN